ALESYEWLFSALLCWCLLTSFWAISPMSSIEGLITLIGGFASVLIYSRGLVNPFSIRRALWFYLIGALVVGTYALSSYETTALVQRDAANNYEWTPSVLGEGVGLSSGEVARPLSTGLLAALLLWGAESR